MKQCYTNLVAQAAAAEPHTKKWEERFTALFADRLLGVAVQPGSEIAMHIRRYPFASYPDRAADFCVERIVATTALPLAAKEQVSSIDLDCIRPPDCRVWLRQFCSRFAAAFAKTKQRPALLLSVRDDHPELESFLSLRRAPDLNYPQLAVRYGHMSRSGKGDKSRWDRLVQLSHADPGIHLVPASAVQPVSGLHPQERADCVLPGSLIEVTTDSAWLMLTVNATVRLAPVVLRRQLRWSLRFADNLIDSVAWLRPAQQVDALLNRRVGLQLIGIGDRLLRAGMPPSEPATFRTLVRWLAFVRRCFIRESVLLARQRGPFPELGMAQLIAELTPRYGAHNAGQLVRNRCLRHRHLLAMSPFTVFPRQPDKAADSGWLNLIPAISIADMLTMSGADVRQRLSLRDWTRLLELTGAQAGRYPATPFFTGIKVN